MKLLIGTLAAAALPSVGAFSHSAPTTHRGLPLRSTTEASVESLSTGGAQEGQAEVVLVGCGAPNRGMGWYHAIQMLEGR